VPEFVEPGQSMRRYLGTIGMLKASISMRSRAPFAPVSADLYDVSDPTRFTAASAASFPFPPQERRPICLDFVAP